MPDNHAIAGGAAGVITSLLLHPVDVIKVRFQVQDGVSTAVTYTNVRGAFGAIVATEGWRGLYRGAGAAAAGSGLSWGLYFYLYEACKRRFNQGGPGERATTAAVNMYAAWEAGALTCCVTNPVWLVKTRLQLQTGSTAPELADAPYRGMVDALRRIVKEEGLLALYKGMLPALALVAHGSVQFTVYEELKFRAADALASPLSASPTLFAIGAASKVVATTVTYPAQVVKSRLQQRFVRSSVPDYSGVVDCVTKVAAREGAAGFYKGFIANLLRVTPQSALTLVAYEQMRAALRVMHPAGEPASTASTATR